MEKKNSSIISNSILDCVGKTPMIRINRILKDSNIACQVFGKAEFLNPGGSIKDRTCVNMIEEAEKNGDLKEGDTIVESSSGNTGIGLALCGAAKGYKVTITVPDNLVKQTIDLIRSLGANVIPVDSSLPLDSPDSYVSLAKKLGEQQGYYYTNKFENEGNIRTHFKFTAEEITKQMENKIDYVFIETSANIYNGISKKLKELNPEIKIIGVDSGKSQLSSLADQNKEKRMFRSESHEASISPKVLDQNIFEEIIKVDEPESLSCCRELLSKEGLFVGEISGCTMAGCIKYLKEKSLSENKDLRCVVMLDDSVHNYFHEVTNNEWMVGKGIYPTSKLNDEDHPFNELTIKDLEMLESVPYYDRRMTISDCFDVFEKGVPMIPIRDNSNFLGVITKKNLARKVAKLNLSQYSSCMTCISTNFLEVSIDTSLSVIQTLLDSTSAVLVTERNENKKLKKVFVVDENLILELLNEKIKEAI